MKTFGEAQLKGGYWELRVEPHVAIRMKRWFPSLSKTAYGVLRLSDTVDNCRELEWFAQRYPLVIKQKKRLKEQAKAQVQRDALVSRIIEGLQEAREFDLKIPAREYQKVAAELAIQSGGLLLADDLGIGKTVAGICVISDPKARPALVVAPSHLQKQWEREIHKFAPGVTTHILRKSSPYDYTKSRRIARDQLSLVHTHPDVLICTYHKLAGWAETLAPVIKGIVFDEVHELRRGDASGKGRASKFVAAKASVRLGLSATPIFNYGGEIFNVLEIVRPGSLGDREEFNREWCSGQYDKARLKDPSAFGAHAARAGLVLRRTREDVGRELPDLVKVPHHVECEESELKSIEAQAADLAEKFLSSVPQSRGESFRAGGELDAMVRHATGLAKATYVAEFVKMILETEKNVVLFGWHRDVYDIWLDKLKQFSPVLYTGSESQNQKDEARAKFCSGESRVMIISLRSGAGLDGLQFSGCRTVVFGELDWSPAVHEQCAGRVHRDGQSETVVSYYLIADSGSDPIVAGVLGVKKGQLDGLRDPSGTRAEVLDSSGSRLRELAEQYLKKSTRAA